MKPLPLQCLFEVGFLNEMTGALANNSVGNTNGTATKIKVLGYITDPMVDSIIQVSYLYLL